MQSSKIKAPCQSMAEKGSPEEKLSIKHKADQSQWRGGCVWISPSRADFYSDRFFPPGDGKLETSGTGWVLVLGPNCFSARVLRERNPSPLLGWVKAIPTALGWKMG